MAGDPSGEPSKAIAGRVADARQRGVRRLSDRGKLSNAEMNAKDVAEFCQTDGEAEALLRNAHDRLQMTGRGFHRVLKLARTIADLDSAETIGVAHLAEAIQYRARAAI